MTPSRQCKSAPLPRRWRALLVLCMSCCAAPLFGVTLGQEHILSLLGDPIEVEIDVLQWDDIDLERVEIALASPAEYESFDLTWLPVLDQLDFNLVGPDGAGAVRVLVSTRDPVAEPYVELLLVMRWPGGSLLREYVLLFDLPETALQADQAGMTVPQPEPLPAPAAEDFQPAATPPAVQRVEVPGNLPEPVTEAPEVAVPPEPLPEPPELAELPESVPEPPELGARPEAVPATEPVASEEAAPEPRNQGAIVVEAAAPATPPPATGRRVYQVREGDGLWSIAQQFQPAGAGENIYQMLLSLHDLNRAAFINGNISLLKANALLQIPDADDIASIDAASAETVFEQRWDEGTARLQTALRGDPLPAFSDLYTGDNVEEGPQAALETRDPAGETGRVAPTPGSLLLPATTPVVVALPGTQAEAGDLVLGEQGTLQSATNRSAATVAEPAAPLAQAPDPVPATINPYLERINASTRDLQALLQNRSLQIAGLEQQLVEMRQRMRDAQQVTARLNEALEQALAQRNAGAAAAARNSTVLGVVALVLLLALLVAMVMLLRLTAQLRSRRSSWSDHLSVMDEPMHASAGRTTASPVAGAVPADSAGIIVEESGMSALDEDEGLQQELLELIGPAVDEGLPPHAPDGNRA